LDRSLLVMVSRANPQSATTCAILDTDSLAPDVLRDLESAIRALPADDDEPPRSGELASSITLFDGVRRWWLASGEASSSDHEELAARIWRLAAEGSLTACGALSVLTNLIAAHLAADEPRMLIHRLAEQAAGIRPGLLGIGDLIRGGSNHLPGAGLLSHYDDGTFGQVRHFCGIAAAVERVGGSVTLLLSERLLGDLPGTPDDHLTRKAMEFTDLLLTGELPMAAAGGWISENICTPRSLSRRPLSDPPAPPSTDAVADSSGTADQSRPIST
jgi:hypothetical protein